MTKHYYAEYVTVYYNKELFAKYGVQVPTTLAEFEAVLDTFVAAGVTPPEIQNLLGNSGGVPVRDDLARPSRVDSAGRMGGAQLAALWCP